MVAAAPVLVSHAYPISLGAGAAGPLEETIGRPLGWVSVAVFFAISGFLITRSFDQRSSVFGWTAARFLRLMPDLLVVTTLTAIILGPLATTLPPGTYFSRPETPAYVPRNLSLAFLQYGLPGVFETNPCREVINGSLWSLFHEVMCYAAVFLIGIAGVLRAPRASAAVFAAYALGYVLTAHSAFGEVLPGRMEILRGLSFPFAIGAAFYVWRDRIRLHWSFGAAGFPALILLRSSAAFEELLSAWISYTSLLLAYVPKGTVRKYNRLGDYSYGVYIYAFPIQQFMVLAFGAMSPAQNIAVSAPCDLALAVLSWHLIEGWALSLRPRGQRGVAPPVQKGQGAGQ